MDIYTLNVRGLRTRTKRLATFRFLKDHKFNIVAMQETYIVDSDTEDWKRQWGGPFWSSPGTKHSKGLILLMSKRFEASCTDVKCTNVGSRLQFLTFQSNDRKFCIVNCYSPCDEASKFEFFRSLKREVEKVILPETHLIMCGDFNVTFDAKLDNVAGEPHKPELVRAFNYLVNSLDCTDIWRVFNGDKKEFTWKRNAPNFVARRLDYIFTNENITTMVKSADIIPFSKSDHDGVRIKIECTQIDRGPGYYKMNNALLSEQDFVSAINEVIEECKQELEPVTNPQILWDICKLRIAQVAKDYSIQRARRNKAHFKGIEQRLNKARDKLLAEPTNRQLLADYERLQLEHEIYLQELARGAQIRSKVNWIEHGEKSSRFFLSLEKVRGVANTISSLVTRDGSTTFDQTEIGKELLAYYETLYQEDSTIDDSLFNNFMDGVPVPVLDETDRVSCEGELTEADCSVALQQMKNDSSPGPDGLGAAFYKVFWPKIASLVCASLNYAFQSDTKLSISQRKALITVIHKGKELKRDEISNYRPISLTNVDYKLGAKVLAGRLQHVIGNLVSTDQSAYIKSRSAADNIRVIEDALWYANQKKVTGILLALDFAKAFDSVSKTMVTNTIKHFKFGPDLLRWITVYTRDTRSAVSYNGWTTPYFDVNRGIRQGCPLSALLFVLSIELMACKLRYSPDIHGIPFATPKARTDIIITQFADDNTLFLGDEQSFYAALHLIDQYGKFSGLKLNLRKCEAMWIGLWKDRLDTLGRVMWKVGPDIKIKILGVLFSNSKSASDIAENWDNKLEKMNNIVKSWKQRQLTILGRILLTKSLLASQMVYLLQALQAPELVIKNINSLLYKFVWNGIEKVKRSVMIQDYKYGGLKMFNVHDFITYVNLRWVQKICHNNSNSTRVPYLLVQELSPNLSIFQYNTDFSVLKDNFNLETIPPFYYNVLKTWYEFRGTKHDVEASDIIWLNNMLTYRANTLFFKRLIQHNLLYVSDFVHDNQVITYDSLTAKAGPSPDLLLQHNVIFNTLNAKLQEFQANDVRGVLLKDNPIISCSKTYIKKVIEGKREDLTQITKHCEAFWNRKFSETFCWKTLWQRPLELELDPRCKELQWKILHNIYPTNIMLQKMGISDSPNCETCNVIDYIEHFFVSCSKIKCLWLEIDRIVHARFGRHIALTEKDILMGIDSNNKEEYKFINKLIIVGKVCISKFKYGKHANLLILFSNELEYRNIKT